MKSLDDMIREIAKRGELNHLSLSGNGKTFTARYRAVTHYAHADATHADPVTALVNAIREGETNRKAERHVRTKAEPAESDVDFG